VQAKARVNRVPPAASQSMFGVRISPHPYDPSAHAPWSSVMNITTLGRRGAVREARARAGAAEAASKFLRVMGAADMRNIVRRNAPLREARSC
jgi:hypothetical protein